MNQRWTFLAAFILTGCLFLSVSDAQTNLAPRPMMPVILPTAPPSPTSVDSVLKWDSDVKEVTVTNGTSQVHFTFLLTNISPDVVEIKDVHTSCGCTSARLPEQPWKLAPGTNGEINVTMNTLGRVGLVPKTVTVTTDKGAKILYVKSNILPPAAPSPSQMMFGEREANRKVALADRQAVFRGDCAKCHTESKDKNGADKMGKELYVSVCAVCHEAEHRATIVPNLHAIAQETNADFWRNWITQGKPGTLMPAFSDKQGGILNDAQIDSLVHYLTTIIPPRAQATLVRPLPPIR